MSARTAGLLVPSFVGIAVAASPVRPGRDEPNTGVRAYRATGAAVVTGLVRSTDAGRISALQRSVIVVAILVSLMLRLPWTGARIACMMAREPGIVR